ncbi:MAG: NAD-binding protein, partial [Thermoanaerobacter sp.]
MKIVIVGTGYVGLTTAVMLAYIGHNVVGVDIDEKKIELLK